MRREADVPQLTELKAERAACAARHCCGDLTHEHDPRQRADLVGYHGAVLLW